MTAFFEEESGPSTSELIGTLVAQGHNMGVMLGRTLDDEASVMQSLREATALLEAHNDPATPNLSTAATVFVAFINDIGRKSDELGISDEDMVQINYIIGTANGSYSSLATRTYNEKVDVFNQTLGTFPANVIGGVRGVNPLDRFDVR